MNTQTLFVFPARRRSLKALTLPRPWAEAIVFGGSRIVNRSWHPWSSILGQRIALHSGIAYDTKGAVWMRGMGLYDPPSESQSQRDVIIGLATVQGHLTQHSSAWFVGPCGWVLEEVEPLTESIPCPSALGLWTVPEHLALELVA
jgi:hypothetical protein